MIKPEKFKRFAVIKVFALMLLLIVTNFIFCQSTSIKDGDNNTLIDVNDEGNYGSITIYPWLTGDEPQDPITHKLYNRGGGLFWGNQQLALNGASGWTDAGTIVRLRANGDNVGIGTLTPTEKLDVSGNINLSGILKLDNFSFLSNTGTHNTLIGQEAGHNSPLEYNTFVGYESGYSSSFGADNTFFGYHSGYNSGTIEENTFYGYRAGYGNTSGGNNTYLGYESGLSVNGNNNTYIGSYSGHGSSSGFNNTFIGVRAGMQNSGGDNGVFCGKDAGFTNSGGDKNTYLGAFARYNYGGSHNTHVGYKSGYNNQGSSNVFIGYESGKNAVGNDILYIENSDSETPLISGDFVNDEVYLFADVGIGTDSPDEKFEIEFAETTLFDIDIEIGQGFDDPDITFIKLVSPDGTPYWLYVDVGGNLTSSATKP